MMVAVRGSQPPEECVTSGAQVRVIIVNYNAGDYLAVCVAHLLAQTEARFQAVVVDNVSTDGSLDRLPDDPRLTIRRLDENIGFAAANNRGFDGCKTPFVAFLNPDAFAAPDWLETLLSAAKSSDSSYVMFGSTQLMADGGDISSAFVGDTHRRLDGAGDCYFFAGAFWRGGHGKLLADQTHLTGDVFGPCAAASLVRSDAYRNIGGFDDRYFCYAEDIDLAFRLRLAGGRCLQVGPAQVVHIGSAITSKLGDFSAYHLTRNQIWTFVKCMPLPLLMVLSPAHILFNVWVLLQSARRGKFVVAWRGVRDALKALPSVWADRMRVQRQRKASMLAIARALVWSPSALIRRSVVMRPVRVGSAEP